MEETISKINAKIKLGENISPFLFIAKNIEMLNSKIELLALDLLKNNNISKIYLHILRDNNESIKIQDIKEFISKSYIKVPSGFQIFFIENISRLTLGASNSLLKFFEEPGINNIIFLSNNGETGVIDTILSRVQVLDYGGKTILKENSYFQSLMNKYIYNNDKEILIYFYKNKLEKEEYLDFLENIIIYSKKMFYFVNYLDELSLDIDGIKNNNLNPRYITDKWLLKMK